MNDLEQQLSDYGVALDELLDQEGRDLHSTPRRPRSRFVGATAAVVLVAVGGGLAITLAATREPDPTSLAPSSTSDTPTSTAQLSWDSLVANTCVDALAAQPMEVWGGTVDLSQGQVSLLPLNSSSSTARVLIDGAAWHGGCTVTSSSNGSANASDLLASGAPATETNGLTPDVIVSDQNWFSDSADGFSGPGFYEVTGRVSARVTQVDVALSDGTTATAALNDGRFYAKVDAGVGVRLFEEQLTWTLADGSTLSQRADLLDAQTDVELCAATPGCVDGRLATLQATAVGQELEALSDRSIADDEYAAALQAVAACARAEGSDVEVIGFVVRVNSDDSGAMAGCQKQHLATLDEARQLLLVSTRLADALAQPNYAAN